MVGMRALLLVFCACGRVAFDPVETVRDDSGAEGINPGDGSPIVEVSAVLNGSSITAIQLGGGATALSMVVQNGQLLAQDAGGTRGMIAYDPTATRFWRIRPAGAIVFEYGDGTTWTQLATSAQTPQATYTTQLIAGEITAVAMPGTARFESVNLCPP